MVMRWFFLATTFILSLSLQCQAQTRPNALRGVSQIQILIEKLDGASTDCGITEESIRDAVLYPVSSANLQITTRIGQPTLYLRLTTLLIKSISVCVTNIEIRVYSLQDVTMDFSGKTLFGEVNLWSNGGIFYSNRPDHLRHVTQMIEMLGQKFVTDWNLDNKPEPKSDHPR